MTERYRLALIAHHAEKLAELVEEQDEKGKVAWWYKRFSLSAFDLMSTAKMINKQLNKEETK